MRFPLLEESSTQNYVSSSNFILPFFDFEAELSPKLAAQFLPLLTQFATLTFS